MLGLLVEEIGDGAEGDGGAVGVSVVAAVDAG